jgi:hypothetical protein
MNFIKLAEQAQKELELEKEKLADRSAKLDVRASSVAAQLELAVEDTKLVALKKKELQDYEEEVTRKALSFKENFDARTERDLAAGDRKEAVRLRKEANEDLDRSRQLLAELSKREVALSEREKVYKQELELEVMRNFTFRK